jgi:coniferyl-aldehyde dehydrogenase
MKAASENLVPVTLELGGKSPVIVAKGHVQDQTVSDIVFGRLLSRGQTCIAPGYALVQESDVDAFVASYDRLVKAAYPDGPTSKDYTSMVNDKQYQIPVDLIEDARAHGAQIIEVGHQPGDASRRPHTLAPTHRARRQPPKGIFERGRWNSTRLVRAPFGRSADALLHFLLR